MAGELLQNKVAIVTGGGAGIGRASSIMMAEHGARIVVDDIDGGSAQETVAAITAAGGEAIAVDADVRDGDAVRAMVKTTLDSYGQIDILVNNAGHYIHPPAHFLDSPETEWQELYDLNMKSVFLCCQAVLPSMIERGAGGSIINLTTVESLRGYPNRVIYSATKGAISAFTRSMSPLIAPHQIRINEIAPDKTWTKQTGPGYERLTAHQADLIPYWVPIGRLGMPEDIAGVVLFLASDLSSFMTGAILNTDGGTLAAAGWFRNTDGTYVNTPNPTAMEGQLPPVTGQR